VVNQKGSDAERTGEFDIIHKTSLGFESSTSEIHVAVTCACKQPQGFDLCHDGPTVKYSVILSNKFPRSTWGASYFEPVSRNFPHFARAYECTLKIGHDPSFILTILRQ
jgi:hypothetical protein